MSYQNPTIEQKLIKVPDVAKRLGISRPTAYSFIKRGLLPHYVLGGYAIRVSEDDLDRFIEESKKTPLPLT